MDRDLAHRLPEVAALCRRHRVARLDVFCSAARQAEGAADLDLPAGAHADAYFGLLDDLEALLGRPVLTPLSNCASAPDVPPVKLI